jgi:hypothetical protein
LTRAARWRGLAALVGGSLALFACGELLGIPGETALGTDASVTGGGEAGAIADGATSADGSKGGETGPCAGVDLSRDGANCGRCGHDCLGGSCEASVCQPLLLASDQGGPFGLAVDDAFLYWADSIENTVKRVGKDGQGLTIVASGVDYVKGVVADGQYVYWGIEDFPPAGGIWRRLRGADAGDPVEQIAQADNVWDLTLFKGRIYFTAWNEGVVRAIDLDGGAPRTLADGINQARHVAVDDSFAYYTSYQSSVYQVPNDGGDASATIGPEDYGADIASDGERVVWGDYHEDGGAELHLWGPGLNNGVAQTIAQGSAPPVPADLVLRDRVAVAMDSDRIYFTFFGSEDGAADGVVAWCPKNGCSASGPVSLAKTVVRPTGLVIDDAAVYFATLDSEGGARVWKVAKP